MFKINFNDANALVVWYDKNKRELPWRDTGNAYDVWLSEVMLQQTRIGAVRPKFTAIKQALPTIHDLATCEDDRFMRLWEGLGYYSRARNILKCARVLCELYSGKLPEDYNLLLKLPGIGPYTAGAIASIAYGIAAPAVDGNVLRVLARYHEDDRDVRSPLIRKEAEQAVMTLFQEKQEPHFVSSFNQGLMELGETVCVPNGTPLCDQCPLMSHCKAYQNKTYDKIPYRSALKQRKVIHRTLCVIRDGNSFLLHKRDQTGLLAGLYEFIGIDRTLTKQEVIDICEAHNIHVLRIKPLPKAKHVFTHLEWHMTAYEILTGELELPHDTSYVLASKKELAHMAVPSAFKTYLDWYTLRDQP